MSSDLPSGWQEATLGAVADINPEMLPGNTNPELQFRYIDVGSIVRPSRLQRPRSIRFAEAPSRARRIVRRNDILVSTVRPYLQSFYRVKDDHSDDLIASTGFAVIRPRERVDSEFIYQHVLSDWFLDHLVPRMKGSNYPAVSAQDVGKYSFPLPPLPEQRRIAKILSSVDDAIQATEAVIEQTRKVKDGVLERLLTKGIGHTELKDSPLGLLPRDWSTVDANSICEQISVGIVIRPSQYYVPYGIKCFRSANIGEGFIKDTDWVYISPESNRLLKKSRLRAGDVLVVRSGYPGTSCVVTQEFNGSNCIDIIFARPKKNLIAPFFLSSFINSRLGRAQIMRAEGGLAQKHFNVGEMKKMLVPVPPLSEQIAISARVSALARAENENAEILRRLRSMKSSLMSDLLAGHKRVLDALLLAAE